MKGSCSSFRVNHLFICLEVQWQSELPSKSLEIIVKLKIISQLLLTLLGLKLCLGLTLLILCLVIIIIIKVVLMIIRMMLFYMLLKMF